MSSFLSQSRWPEIREKIQAKWGKFTSREIESLRSDLDALVKQIQKSYGYERKRAEREYHDFMVSIRPMFQILRPVPLPVRKITLK